MVVCTMWSEIAAIYRASKKKRDINWFTEWICRPPAACVVYALRDSRVTPNQLTFLSLAVAMAAGLLWALVPGWAAAALGALLFEVSFVLDCADGQLARLRKMTSPLGHLLDFLMDEIKAMLIFAAIALRLYRGSGDDIYLLAGLAGLLALASGLRRDFVYPPGRVRRQAADRRRPAGRARGAARRLRSAHRRT